MKESLKYIITFIVTITILIASATLVNKIPRKMIQKNVISSAKYLLKREEKRKNKSQLSSIKTDEYADAITLNIIYSMDNKRPLESFLYSKYYRDNIKATEFLLENAEKEKHPNQEYIRYFHGSIVLLKPLLIVFSVKEIFIIFFSIFLLLTIILLVRLYKLSKSLSLIVFISFLMTFMYIAPFALEYIWTILIMLIVTLIALNIEKTQPKQLPYLFIISGTLTCFFDFLTTETLTCLFPLSIIIIVRIKEKRLRTNKEAIKMVLKLGSLWMLAYSFSWFTKWILSSIILNINAMDYVRSNAVTRINGTITGNILTQMLGAIGNNVYQLVPFCFMKVGKIILLTVMLIGMIDIFIVMKKKEKWISQILLFLALIPLIRYMVLSNHSYIHSFFTYRALATTIINLLAILIYGLDWGRRDEEK